MAQVKSSLEIVEEWKEKCYQFFTKSDDALASTMLRLLEASSVILKGHDHSRIQRALTFLECERSLNMLAENSDEPSIRYMMYGVLQSIHGTFLDMTSSKDSMRSEEIQAAEIVDEWKNKCYKFFNQSDDVLASTMLRLLEAASFILKSYDVSRIHRALTFFECERSHNMLAENTEEPSIRTIMYGVLQSIHGTLMDMTSSKDSLHSDEIQANEVLNSSPSLPTKPREEPVTDSQTIPCDNQIPAEDLMTSKEGEITDENVVTPGMEDDGSKSFAGLSTIPKFTRPIPIEPKREAKEEPKNIKEEEKKNDFVIPNHVESPVKPKEEPVHQIQDLPDDNKMHDEFDQILEEDNNDITANMEEMNGTDETELGGEDSAKTLIEKEGEDEKEMSGEAKNTRKKRKSSNKRVSKSESAKKKHKGPKMNSTELECPECDYRTKYVESWAKHLRRSHSTTPMKAGLAFLCECGIESRSEDHSRKCDLANTTIIAKRSTTPKCALCEIHPKNIVGYIYHLRDHHKSTLKKNKTFLKCACGLEVFSDSDQIREHARACGRSHEFTLHKLDEK